MSFASPPLADVYVSVRIFIHAFPVVRRRCFLRLLRIHGGVFFVQKLIAAVTAHPPVAKPTLTTTTTVATWTALAATTAMTLANQTHARPHI